MAAKITTIWILYVHVVLNDVIFKQLLDEDFWISRIIKFEVRVFCRITETLIILDTTKTESSNCFIIRWTKEKWKSCFCFFSDGKQHKARKLDMNTRDLSVLDTQGDLECPWHSRWPWVFLVGGAVASWLVRSTPELAVRDRALTRDTALCSWTRHLTLTMPLSTQMYKWVSANLMLGGNPAMN